MVPSNKSYCFFISFPLHCFASMSVGLIVFVCFCFFLYQKNFLSYQFTEIFTFFILFFSLSLSLWILFLLSASYTNFYNNLALTCLFLSNLHFSHTNLLRLSASTASGVPILNCPTVVFFPLFARDCLCLIKEGIVIGITKKQRRNCEFVNKPLAEDILQRFSLESWPFRRTALHIRLSRIASYSLPPSRSQWNCFLLVLLFFCKRQPPKGECDGCVCMN